MARATPTGDADGWAASSRSTSAWLIGRAIGEVRPSPITLTATSPTSTARMAAASQPGGDDQSPCHCIDYARPHAKARPRGR